MKIKDLFLAFNWDYGDIIIELIEYDPCYSKNIIDTEEFVLRNIKEAGAFISEFGNLDILDIRVIDYDSAHSANGVSTLRVLVAS